MRARSDAGGGVLLCYRLSREPSRPQITVWREPKELRHVQAFVKSAIAVVAGPIALAVIARSNQTVSQLPKVATALVTLSPMLRWKVEEPDIPASPAIAGITSQRPR